MLPSHDIATSLDILHALIDFKNMLNVGKERAAHWAITRLYVPRLGKNPAPVVQEERDDSVQVLDFWRDGSEEYDRGVDDEDAMYDDYTEADAVDEYDPADAYDLAFARGEDVHVMYDDYAEEDPADDWDMYIDSVGSAPDDYADDGPADEDLWAVDNGVREKDEVAEVLGFWGEDAEEDDCTEDDPADEGDWAFDNEFRGEEELVAAWYSLMDDMDDIDNIGDYYSDY